MPIIKQGQLFYLHSDNTSMIIEEQFGYLFLKHFGRKVEQYHGSNAVIWKDHAFSGNPFAERREFSMDTQRHVIGQHGLGDFRERSIRIQHSNNELTDFRYQTYEIVTGVVESEGLPSPFATEDDASTLILTLVDEVAQLELKLHYTVYETQNTITTFTTVTNLSDEQVVVHKLLSVLLDLPSREYDVMTFQGAYAREKTYRRHTLGQGLHQISSARGASGHGQTPSMIIAEPSTTEDFGEAIAIQLMYSGNFEAFAQVNQLNELRTAIGINEANFSWELAKGETFNTPVALMTFTDQGLNRLSHESQQFIKNHIMSPQFANKERPILINNWEATYFDFDQSKLVSLADQASEVGIELFVLDDGWFGNRSDDNRALGDWQVNEAKIGGSLADLISEIKGKGLKFGIWIEPEMISEDSDLYRQHPNWAIQVPQRAHIYSRNQLVLNYANSEVIDYMKNIFDQLLSEHEIDYVKWDMNRNMTNIGNGATYQDTRMQSHRYMLGLYELVAYLTDKHSDILFESCSGGGGRNDLGMMRYFPQVWSSDNTDAIGRLAIQHGSSFLYPVISMGAHVSAAPNHQMNRVTSLKTRGDVAMMGNLGYELDLSQLSVDEKTEVTQQVETYKQLRPIVQFGQQFRLISPIDASNETAVQFVHEDKVLVTYVKVLSTIEAMETTVKLKGLEASALYQLSGTEQRFSGAELMYAGYTLNIPQGDFQTMQLLFTRFD